MNEDTAKSSRQKKVDRYLRATDFGTGAMLLYPFIVFGLPLVVLNTQQSESLVLPFIWLLAAVIFLVLELVTVIYIFFRRKTDEFTEAMWHSGATYAFFAAIVWLLIGGWIETLLTPAGAEVAYYRAEAETLRRFEEARDLSVFTAEDLMRVGPDIVRRYATPVIISAFFVGQQVKRFRGGL